MLEAGLTKIQKQDFDTLKLKSHIINISQTPLLLGVLVFFIACKNDIKHVQKVTTQSRDTAIMSAINFETLYTINGLPNVNVKAPYLNRYIDKGEISYSEFPDGIELYFYDEQGHLSSSLRANYSIYYEKEGRWEAKYDVEVINEKNEKLNTEYLVWLREEKKITSDQFVKVTNSDGIIYGDGFESNQEFTSWEVINGRGVINIDTNE